MSACNLCGACCRVLTVEQSPAEIQAMAALTRALGIPSDHQFAADHWRPLERNEALGRNPFYVRQLPPDAHLYTCDRLSDDGACTAHSERPSVCRGYPWYDEVPAELRFADPDCGYMVDQVHELVIRRRDL